MTSLKLVHLYADNIISDELEGGYFLIERFHEIAFEWLGNVF